MASTIRDVAARAGLSVGTVSKYINGKTVKESTRLAIEEAIKELDFHPTIFRCTYPWCSSSLIADRTESIPSLLKDASPCIL